jgi:hypothetical protein
MLAFVEDMEYIKGWLFPKVKRYIMEVRVDSHRMGAAIISYVLHRALGRPEEMSMALDSTSIEKLAKVGLRLCLKPSSKHNWERNKEFI